ncbi:MAG: UDP-N-acetylmuramoyl-L-alanyl-D-glutamate--2,6-diaminopimelate ligase [Casimicrobiaceae bacterium]|nr:UDP-N-acetylmuramoyl-L-alanyl-D-glutamate--2,6-diaminopimelate ligase [Casimicrobiaceae bacterium]MCX8098808.1 UDP-N-acetylmuramoyl-L-alanyl-D-glutamate--2,6-diaminopimelate ligase [Casimicrobiaceae bacterium]MDW8311539.1 UDP-N-acetylmuramoyl-L-alanyl-D-glutamate--2,6-diaminopimelate ligase [Burkholderiales bacterium]
MSELAQRLAALGLGGRRLVLDSRRIRPGDIFVAQRGLSADGHDYIAAAVARGAAAVIAERLPAGLSVPGFVAPTHEARYLAQLCNAYYNHPSRRLRVIGVTGTNGKTSVTQWLAEALSAEGEPCAVIGTLGVDFAGEHEPTLNTTPDGVTLHGLLAQLADRGARAVAMEVSSHALAQERVAGVDFDTVVFTNLSPDHLDYHGTMEAYGAAKARLFSDFPARLAAINLDDAFGRHLAATTGLPVLSYGFESAQVSATQHREHAMGQSFCLVYAKQSAPVQSPTVGRFNVSNLLAVAAVLLGRGLPLDRVAARLSMLSPVRGRLERVRLPDGSAASAPEVYVDYAHTPDALEKALLALRPRTAAQLWVVFGCGGNRDRSKRAPMGRIAAACADRVVLTTDNPRFEDPQAILADVAAGIAGEARSRTLIEPDRRSAIARALSLATAGDTVLIAGKGHETYQEVAGVRHPFDDVEVAREILMARFGSSATPEGRHV